jgi:hypothetical protein
LAGELIVTTPSPTPSPTPTPVVTPSPSPSPTASPTSSPTPTPATSLSIADARRRPVGTTVSVSGVVTAEAGRLGTPSLIAIQDATAGIVVRVPDGVPAPARGTRVDVRGTLADPYGQLEVRPPTSGFVTSGSETLPGPEAAATLSEMTEGRLVVVTGVVEARPTKSTSLDIAFDLRSPGGSIRIVADASSRLTQDSVKVGATYRIVGVAGQRASRKDAPDGYRAWPRDAADLVKLADPAPTASPAPSGGVSAGSGSVLSIAEAVRREEGPVTVEGLVTTRPDLLDTGGRRIVIEDRTAAVEVLLPVDAGAPSVGSRVRVEGEIGRAYDAPRVRAERITVVATGGRPQPLDLDAAPTAANEWRLVRISGTITEVHKLGDRWRAELATGGGPIVLNGLAGARIPATALVAGRRATVVGIVRRPYPGATDRRWSVVPRGMADLTISGGSGAGATRGDGPASGSVVGADGSAPAIPDVDLARLADHVGQTVRVGGLVANLEPDGFTLDDGTAEGRVALAGAAAEYLSLLEPGDAINATGRVVEDGDGFRVVVDDPAGLARIGDPSGATITATPRPELDVIDPTASEPPGSRLAGGFLGIAEFGGLGFAGGLLIALASVAVTVLRRQRARRLVASRVAARLARVTGSAPPEA